MGAEAEVVDQTDTTTTTEKEITLDDVYREAKLDTAADTSKVDTHKTETTQETHTKTEPLSIPDPYDSENFKAFMAREAAGKTELQKTVTAVVAHLTAKEREGAVAATKADIERAVGKINEVVGHHKPKVIEAALDGMVRENPQLKAIWENRGKNPGAWDKALGIVTKQIAEDFSVKVDPNLVSAQRARKESQKHMATTTQDTAGSAVEDRLAAAQGSDFESQWERLKGGN